MALEHRVSFRVTADEWNEYQALCEESNITPSDRLRPLFRSDLARMRKAVKGGDLTIEDFVYTYVDWIEGMSFDEAYALAVDRDREAADELRLDIYSKG